MKKLGLFAVGVLFGTAGIKLLGSRDAKKVYAHTTAAALRAKEGVMKTVTAVRGGAEDKDHQRMPRRGGGRRCGGGR